MLHTKAISFAVVEGIILALGLCVGVYFRTHLSQFADGEFFVGPDSFRYVRYIHEIASQDALPAVDMMRHVPTGYKIRFDTVAFPWLVVHAHKVLEFVFPDFPLELVIIFYPAVIACLTGFIYFLFVRQMIDSLTALLATIAFTIIPTVTVRTSTGYVDTDALILFLFLLAMFFHILKHRSRNLWRMGIYQIISSCALAGLGLVWLGVALPAAILFGSEILLLFGLGGIVKRRRSLISLAGIVIYIAVLFGFPTNYRAFPFSTDTLAAIIPSILVAIFHLTTVIGIDIRHRLFSIGRWRLLVLLLVLCYPIYQLLTVVGHILTKVLLPYGTDPVMTHIIELQAASLKYWWFRYGVWFVAGFMGFFMFIKKNCLHVDFPFRKLHISLAAIGCFCVFISSFTQPYLLKQPIWIRGIISLVPISWVTLHTSWLFHRAKKDDLIVLAVWFLVSLTFTVSAVRFSLVHAPTFVLMGAFLLTCLFDFVVSGIQKNRAFRTVLCLSLISWMLFFCGTNLITLLQRAIQLEFFPNISLRAQMLMNIFLSLMFLGVLLFKVTMRSYHVRRLLGVMAIFVICIFTYKQIGQRGIISAKYIFEIPRMQLFKASMQRLQKSTASDAVIAADWGHGSMINALGNRATIIDEEQDTQRIRAFYQKVLLGTSIEGALDFFQNHHATHLMLLSSNVLERLDEIWTMAYPDKLLNRPLSIVMQPESLGKDYDKSFQYALSTPLSVSLDSPHNGDNLNLHVDRVITNFDWDDGALAISEAPQAALDSKDKHFVGIQGLVIADQQWYFPEAELPLTMWINASIIQTPFSSEIRAYNVVLLTEEAHDFNAVKLFLNEAEGEYLKNIDMEQSDLKLWHINYDFANLAKITDLQQSAGKPDNEIDFTGLRRERILKNGDEP